MKNITGKQIEAFPELPYRWALTMQAMATRGGTYSVRELEDKLAELRAANGTLKDYARLLAKTILTGGKQHATKDEMRAHLRSWDVRREAWAPVLMWIAVDIEQCLQHEGQPIGVIIGSEETCSRAREDVRFPGKEATLPKKATNTVYLPVFPTSLTKALCAVKQQIYADDAPHIRNSFGDHAKTLRMPRSRDGNLLVLINEATGKKTPANWLVSMYDRLALLEALGIYTAEEADKLADQLCREANKADYKAAVTSALAAGHEAGTKKHDDYMDAASYILSKTQKPESKEPTMKFKTNTMKQSAMQSIKFTATHQGGHAGLAALKNLTLKLLPIKWGFWARITGKHKAVCDHPLTTLAVATGLNLLVQHVTEENSFASKATQALQDAALADAVGNYGELRSVVNALLDPEQKQEEQK